MSPNFNGLFRTSTKSYPIKETIAIMTSFPSVKAKMKVRVLILDNPPTTLISADGENGKQ